MSTYTKALTSVNDSALQHAADAHNASLPAEATPLTAHQYLDKVLDDALKSWQDQYIRTTGSAFLLRFPPGKIDAIKTAAQADAQLAGLVAELEAAPYVYTGSTLVRGGIAGLVAAGLLTQAQADAILA